MNSSTFSLKINEILKEILLIWDYFRLLGWRTGWIYTKLHFQAKKDPLILLRISILAEWEAEYVENDLHRAALLNMADEFEKNYNLRKKIT